MSGMSSRIASELAFHIVGHLGGLLLQSMMRINPFTHILEVKASKLVLFLRWEAMRKLPPRGKEACRQAYIAQGDVVVADLLLQLLNLAHHLVEVEELLRHLAILLTQTDKKLTFSLLKLPKFKQRKTQKKNQRNYRLSVERRVRKRKEGTSAGDEKGGKNL